MLPHSARIKSSSDFARVTKTGRRISTNSLIGYFYTESTTTTNHQKLGLIVGKSIGNSVVRNRIARQIRHAVGSQLTSLPDGTMLVIRVIRKPESAFIEAQEVIAKFLRNSETLSAKTKAKV